MGDEERANEVADALLAEYPNGGLRDLLALAYVKGTMDGLKEGRDIAEQTFDDLRRSLA